MTFRHGNTKASRLTGVKVMEIREKYAAGTHTQAQLSREYQVAINTIRNIVTGVTWQNVPLIESQDEILTQAKISERRFNTLFELDPNAPVEEIFTPESQERLRSSAERANDELGLNVTDPMAVFMNRGKLNESREAAEESEAKGENATLICHAQQLVPAK